MRKYLLPIWLLVHTWNLKIAYPYLVLVQT